MRRFEIMVEMRYQVDVLVTDKLGNIKDSIIKNFRLRREAEDYAKKMQKYYKSKPDTSAVIKVRKIKGDQVVMTLFTERKKKRRK